MNTRSTRRDLVDEENDTDEQRPTGSVLDELIEHQLRTISDQNNLHIQQTERFNQVINQYEERIGKIEDRQERIVTNVKGLNDNVVALVERIDLIEKRGKVWDANQGKAQIAYAELTTRVEESLTKELQVVDAKVREYVRQLD
jgi:hypothetical protein